MGLFQIFNIPRTNVVSSVLQFPAIDTDGMIKRMRLKQRAKDQSQGNLPAADSEGFDAVEQDIVNEIMSEGKTQFNAYISHQKTYADRANDAGILALVANLRSIAAGASTDFERQTLSGTNELYARRREVIDTERELQRFRKRHKLERTTRDVDSRTFKVGVLILILAVESILNGFFLSKGNVFGLVGGVFEALLIASLNVFVSAAVGRFVVPWLSYRSWGARVVAAFGVLAYLAAVISFNLAVAHYRNAVASDPFGASIVAYRTLLANPLGIADVQSWSLFLFGLSFSFIAAYDGLRMDDPYPGYGHRMRQNRVALEDYNDLTDDLLNELEDIKKSAELKMDEIARQLETRRGEFGYVVVKSQALTIEMKDHFAHLESAANTLLRYYRDENRKARTLPSPARFDTPWVYPRPPLYDSVIPEHHAIIATMTKALEEAMHERDTLHAAYRKALAEYSRIHDLVE